MAADAINRELAHGKPRHIAAWLGPRTLARAVFYATLTNIVAFVPLLLVKGKTGDFIYSLPIVVSFSLVASMLVAWTFAPLSGLLYAQRAKEPGRFRRTSRPGIPPAVQVICRELHRPSLSHGRDCLDHSVRGYAGCRTIGTSFFPKDLHNVFVVNLDLPEGTPIRATRDVAMEAIRKIDALEGKRIRSYTTFVGAGGPRFWLSIEPEQALR